ncbi:HyaD/HybD family hydrogenase maturation endopeptidase [Selenomonas sp. AB3002]|uniref:HyaD/HybD family hydrogenase maturation endopeptidase n=1 Tax=Selenomonas sp. AB3002 TaxID=1392502 RepID=UPI0004981686
MGEFGLTEAEVTEELAKVLHQSDITVLGIGNVVLRDEGFGVRVAEYLDKNYIFPDNVQIVDGGVLGIELMQFVTDTQKLLIIDSINGGAEAGTTFRFANDEVLAHFQDKLSAHEVGIQDVLAALEVTGRKIPEVVVIGAQPFDLSAGVELSAGMAGLLEPMAEQALKELAAWGVVPEERFGEIEQDLSVVAEELVRKEAEKPSPQGEGKT